MADSKDHESFPQFSPNPGTYDLEPQALNPKKKSSPENQQKSEQSTDEPISFWEQLFKRHRPLEKETAFFILVSALDVFMTWLLLRRSGYRESNVIANFFLNHWGMQGMVYFKFGMVAFVCILTQIIAVKKEETARYILHFAVVVLVGVVIYSLSLLLRFG